MERVLKIVAIVQARMGSTRFPNKVMRPICATPMIGLLLERLSGAQRLDEVVLATSDDVRNEPLASYVREIGYVVYRGSENDVLDRYYQAARSLGADAVVRITGDCPLIDPTIVDGVIARFLDSGVDYAANILPPTLSGWPGRGGFQLQSAGNRLEASHDRARARARHTLHP